MDEATRIERDMRHLLQGMYELGKAEGRGDIEEAKEEAHTRGVDAGFNEGYEEARIEFRVPDL